MDNSNFGQPPPNPGNVWPPPPAPEPGVWPPPPTGQPQGFWFPFKTLLTRAEGSVPNFRLGSINLSESGVYIQGKAVTRYEIQVPILIACLFLRLGFLIAYMVLEYAIRRDEVLTIPWAQVRQVVLVPNKQRVCLVYDAPNYKGVVKTYSLAFKPDPGQYEKFAATADQFIPGRVQPGKLRGWTSPAVTVFLCGVVLSLVIVVVLIATGALNSSS